MKEENLCQNNFSENSNKSSVKRRKSKKKSKDSEKFFNFKSQSNKTNLIQNEKFVKHEESLFKNQTNSYNIHLSNNYKEELYKKFSVFLQSKKFKISNQFDEKNSKKFLEKKDKYLERIVLSDIIETNENNNNNSKRGSTKNSDRNKRKRKSEKPTIKNYCIIITDYDDESKNEKKYNYSVKFEPRKIEEIKQNNKTLSKYFLNNQQSKSQNDLTRVSLKSD